MSYAYVVSKLMNFNILALGNGKNMNNSIRHQSILNKKVCIENFIQFYSVSVSA